RIRGHSNHGHDAPERAWDAESQPLRPAEHLEEPSCHEPLSMALAASCRACRWAAWAAALTCGPTLAAAAVFLGSCLWLAGTGLLNGIQRALIPFPRQSTFFELYPKLDLVLDTLG